MQWHQNSMAGLLATQPQPEVSQKQPSNSRFWTFFFSLENSLCF